MIDFFSLASLFHLHPSRREAEAMKFPFFDIKYRDKGGKARLALSMFAFLPDFERSFSLQ